tara:strand:- start:5531 stop:5830 length:300 start_codon:yes stop_codon:yes gene_type:complete
MSLIELLQNNSAEYEKIDSLLRARGENYGPPEEFFQQLSEAWSSMSGTHITPGQAAAMMIVFKAIRLYASPTHKDSIDDIKGYARIAEILVELEEIKEN